MKERESSYTQAAFQFISNINYENKKGGEEQTNNNQLHHDTLWGLRAGRGGGGGVKGKKIQGEKCTKRTK